MNGPTMTLKAQLKLLSQLQEHQFEGVRLHRRLEDIPRRLGELEQQKIDLENQLESEKERIGTLKKQYREMERLVQEDERKIEKSKEKLAIVKTNKEYQSSLKEIEEMQGKIGTLEDGMLELLEQIEAAEAEYEQHTLTFKSRLEELEQAAQRIHHDQRDLVQRLSVNHEARDEVCGQIPPELMIKYERVQKLGIKPAIAPVVNAVCRGCNMNVPPQRFIELQRFEELTFCPHCQCIIFWQAAEE
jgi:predicted  nucleic acid-binding Zn-ribbon protein